VDQGFERKVTAHELLGVGLKEGRVVLDDGADAASLAHELGQALGLDDLKAKAERDRMMYWVRRDRSDFLFTYGEMKDARESAQARLKKWSRSGVTASAPPKR
jgi:IS5 family transposase